jgi:hypothetical protein
MRERGRYQIQLMKTRSSSGVGQKVDLGFDIDTLRIVDIDEDEQESTNGERSGNSSIIDSIKRKTATTGESNTPTDDPTDGASVGKIRGKVESTKLREILSNMGSDEEY